MSNISTWTTSAASNNSVSPDGFPENMAPSGVNDSAREVMAAVRRWYVDAEWINWGHTPVRQSANSFLVSLTATQIYTAGRRLKLYDATTILGEVLASSPSGANTLITVSASSLTSSLTSLSIGIADPAGLSLPGTQWSSVRGLAASNNASVNSFPSISCVSITFIGRNVSPIVIQNPSIIAIDIGQAQAGSVAGQRDAATSFSNIDVHFYGIYGNGTINGLASASGPASFNGTTLPSGYNRWAYLFSQPMTAVSLSEVTVRGNTVYWSAYNTLNAAIGTSEVTLSATSACPTIASSMKVWMQVVGTTTGAGSGNLRITSGTNFIVVNTTEASGSLQYATGYVDVPNIAQTLYAIRTAGTGSCQCYLLSYTVPNGG